MIKKILTLGAAALLCCGTATLAQQNDRGEDRRGDDRGRWDPAQFQQRIMEGVKERLEVKDDAEWKALQPMVEKVMTAQRQVMGDRVRGLMGRRGGESDRRGGPGGPPSGGMFGQQPNPDADALQRAIDSKASKSELKAAMDKYVESRKAHQDALESAQADLRKVLTPRQEAIATLSGLL